MRVLLTGSEGLVGREISRRWANSAAVVGLGHRDLDVADRAAVRSALLREKPDVVINCAAVGVDACEANPELAFRVNVAGPAILAAGTREIDATLVHFSSNYVFGGDPNGHPPYTIDDVPCPVNVYGRTKLDGERAAQEAHERLFVVRTSWVFGRGKETFLGTAPARLREGRRLRAITDVRASTTYVRDLSQRLAEILATGHPGTYHVVNAGSCSYHEFAQEAARLVGRTPAEAQELIEAVTEDEMNRAAPRPRDTPLRCLLSERLGLPPLRDWRGGLAAYVAERDHGESD